MKIPVMTLEIEDIGEDIINHAHLKELMKTPEQRRAEKHARSTDQRDVAHQFAKVRRTLGRGLRLKCALGKFNKEVQARAALEAHEVRGLPIAAVHGGREGSEAQDNTGRAQDEGQVWEGLPKENARDRMEILMES